MMLTLFYSLFGEANNVTGDSILILTISAVCYVGGVFFMKQLRDQEFEN